MSATLTFDAVSEARPGPRWLARWHRSWPAYEAWFCARGGDAGPSRAACGEALAEHMPELVPVWEELTALAGGSDRAARFFSTWCPPAYLGGCSLAALADADDVQLVRNYDLSPDLNEGLLLRTEWTGRAVMGMTEFLWGLSDGINDAGLSVALAFGGRSETGRGFGITTILRYVLETCDTVPEALKVLGRVPSHMAYNIVLADAGRRTASVELAPGGGMRVMPRAIACNHQDAPPRADRPGFTRSFERYANLEAMTKAPGDLMPRFLKAPLFQTRYGEGFGTLFTAGYAPLRRTLCLSIAGEVWHQSLDDFREGQRVAQYDSTSALVPAPEAGPDWSRAAYIDWAAVARDYAAGQGRAIAQYLPAPAQEAAVLH